MRAAPHRRAVRSYPALAILMAVLSASVLALYVTPLAAAHACNKAAVPDCNARHCPEGEAHYHEEYSEQGDKQYCRTRADSPVDKGCHYYYVTWPESACWIFEGAHSPPLLA